MAQSLEITSSIIEGGCEQLPAGSLALNGTMGHTDSATLQAGSLTLRGGFWQAPVVCVGDIADDFGFPGADGQTGFGNYPYALTILGPCP